VTVSVAGFQHHNHQRCFTNDDVLDGNDERRRLSRYKQVERARRTAVRPSRAVAVTVTPERASATARLPSAIPATAAGEDRREGTAGTAFASGSAGTINSGSMPGNATTASGAPGGGGGVSPASAPTCDLMP
jgi:hypothetical protein